jgi:hypothetical protein
MWRIFMVIGVVSFSLVVIHQFNIKGVFSFSAADAACADYLIAGKPAVFHRFWKHSFLIPTFSVTQISNLPKFASLGAPDSYALRSITVSTRVGLTELQGGTTVKLVNHHAWRIKYESRVLRDLSAVPLNNRRFLRYPPGLTGFDRVMAIRSVTQREPYSWKGRSTQY